MKEGLYNNRCQPKIYTSSQIWSLQRFFQVEFRFLAGRLAGETGAKIDCDMTE